MENATKALLIAASVLIVIVLISLGLVLLNSGSEVQSQAKSVGTSIQEQSGQAASSAVSSMQEISKVSYTPEEFNDKICPLFLEYQRNGKYTDKYSFIEGTFGDDYNTNNVICELERIKTICNKTNRQILSAYAYKSYYENIEDTIKQIRESPRSAYEVEYLAGEDGYISKIRVSITMPAF